MGKGKRKKDKQKKRRRAAGGPNRAEREDVYRLYEAAVQDPEGDVKRVQRMFRRRFGRPPRLLREDFCGTAAMACEWVRGHRENRAWGIDIDPEPLAWSRRHHLPGLRDHQLRRLELLQGDVREVSLEPVDVTVAFNFSYLVFQRRSELKRYFEIVRSGLRPEGLLVLDLYGGAEAMQTMTELRDCEGFDYVWDQDVFDPIQHHAVNHIHFEFEDGSRIDRAFSYDWRLWTLPELRDVLEDAGFSASDVYWEGTDQKTNEGTGTYYRATSAPDDPAWIAYVVAVR